MAEIKIFNPDGIYRPKSPHMQVTRARGSELAFIAGQVPLGVYELACTRVSQHVQERGVSTEYIARH